MRKSKSSVAVDCFLPGRTKDLSAPMYLSDLDQNWTVSLQFSYSEAPKIRVSAVL